MWQTLPNSDSGASGLVSCGNGRFLVVNEDRFWQIELDPLTCRRLDFTIEGAVELEAISAIPWLDGHHLRPEKTLDVDHI